MAFMEVYLRASRVVYTSLVLGDGHGRNVGLGKVGSADEDKALVCVPRAGANQVAISHGLSRGTRKWPSLIEVAMSIEHLLQASKGIHGGHLLGDDLLVGVPTQLALLVDRLHAVDVGGNLDKLARFR